MTVHNCHSLSKLHLLNMDEFIEFYCTSVKLRGKNDSIVSGLSNWAAGESEQLFPDLGDTG